MKQLSALRRPRRPLAEDISVAAAVRKATTDDAWSADAARLLARIQVLLDAETEVPLDTS